MVQRRAARFTLGRFHNTSSVTEMLQDLEWESLQCRRKRTDVLLFYKIQHQLVAVPMPPIVIRSQRPRPNSPHHFLVPFCVTEAYKNSYFPHTVQEWNALPSSLASQEQPAILQGCLHPTQILNNYLFFNHLTILTKSH